MARMQVMIEGDLARFLTAQDAALAQVEVELTAGLKRSHWMWFVFPQIAGLGRSATARFFAIADIEEAGRYLGHPVLGERLRRHVRLAMTHSDRTARDIFGSPDDLKFRSCLTLFSEASATSEDRGMFAAGLLQFYDGRPDPQTLAILQAPPSA